VVSAALVVPLLALGDAGELVVPLSVAAVAVLLNVLTAGSVRTAAGPNGVAVRFGVLGWPRGTYAIDRIERAEVADVPPWSVAYGFWWTPRRTVCTVRPGPNLRLTLDTGRTVTVTVPDPHAAVAALTAARRGA
jgi:hypothetical protein